LTSSRIVAAAALAGSGAILVAALVSAAALAMGAPEMVRNPFLLICHGQAERAFHLMEVALPICARCTGIYGGLALTAVPFVIFPGAARVRLAGRIALVLAAPLVLDGLMQTFGVWSSGNLPRAATGILFAVSIGWWAITSVGQARSPAWEATTSAGEAASGS
jgi:uncharacterized membrane protein